MMCLTGNNETENCGRVSVVEPNFLLSDEKLTETKLFVYWMSINQNNNRLSLDNFSYAFALLI